MPARRTTSLALAATALLFAVAPGVARADLAEDFGPYAGAGLQVTPPGWSAANLSSPSGTNSWFQGNPPSNGGPFVAHQGAEHAYAAVNFNSTSGSTGTISNWLVTPVIETLSDGDEVSFFTRRPIPQPGGQVYADRLELRLSTNGSCSPGATSGDVGAFTTLLRTVNPNLTRDDWPTGYPGSWTQISAVLRGLPADPRGCFAFRYHVTGAGPTGTNSDYIGIDTFRFTDDVTPPAAPQIGSVSPGSPSNDAAPRARGLAEAYATVRIYGDATCTGPALGSGGADDFAAGGIAFAATADATTTPYATATDGSLNVSPCSAAGPSYDHDGTAPQTEDDVPAPWQPEAPEVTLTATDDRSGVAATHYEVGADPAVPTTASPAYDPADKPRVSDGERIRYFSVDTAGNEEVPRLSEPASVDTTAPETSDDVTAATLPGAAVTLDAADGAGSGVAATHYEVGADPALPTTSSPAYDAAAKPVLADGERIRYFSVDAVGNAEAPRSSQTVVAPIAPPEPRTPDGPQKPPPPAPAVTLTERPAELARARAVRIAFTVDPSAAGYECRIDGGAWTVCSSPFEPPRLDAGDHAVDIRAVMADGRRGAPTAHAFQINPYAPGIALTGSALRASRTGIVAAQLGCSPREGEGRGRCIGTVRLTHATQVKGRRGKRVRVVRVLARGSFDLTAAATADLRLRMTPAARRLLGRAGGSGLAVRLVVDAHDLADNRAVVSFARPLTRAR